MLVGMIFWLESPNSFLVKSKWLNISWDDIIKIVYLFQVFVFCGFWSMQISQLIYLTLIFVEDFQLDSQQNKLEIIPIKG